LANLFGSSGVRGIVNEFLTPELACKIGLASASRIKAKKALIARDTRTSGLMIKEALISGLLSCGVDVTDLGIIPTPVLAYLTMNLKADIGFMLTASHNPAQYNGIKIFDKTSLSYSDYRQSKIENIIKKERYCLSNWKYVGKNETLEADSIYLKMVKKRINLQKNWKIILDPGCGATFSIGSKILSNYGFNVTVLNAQPDGTFPARKSEPTKESLGNLSKIVTTLSADIGIAFDGDGDRVAFIDKKGNFLDFDKILAAFARYILKKHRGGMIVTNVESSMCIDRISQRYDGKIIRTKVGDVYLSEAIKKRKAIFGGEPCGAWIHPQFHYCPDGPLSAILLLKALEDESKSIDEFIVGIPEFITIRENILCRNQNKKKIINKLKKKIRIIFPEYKEISNVDGIRTSFENGWILIRASGTEPLIRLTVEGESLKIARDILDRVIKTLKGIMER
jgi:phosphoglucosamine mutase